MKINHVKHANVGKCKSSKKEEQCKYDYELDLKRTEYDVIYHQQKDEFFGKEYLTKWTEKFKDIKPSWLKPAEITLKPDATPLPKKKAYPFRKESWDTAETLIADMLKEDIIEPSTAASSMPCLVVKKAIEFVRPALCFSSPRLRKDIRFP